MQPDCKKIDEIVIRAFEAWHYPRPEPHEIAIVEDEHDETVDFESRLRGRSVELCIAEKYCGGITPPMLTKKAWLYYFPAIILCFEDWYNIGLPPMNDPDFEMLSKEEVVTMFTRGQLEAIKAKMQYLLENAPFNVDTRELSLAWESFWKGL